MIRRASNWIRRHVISTHVITALTIASCIASGCLTPAAEAQNRDFIGQLNAPILELEQKHLSADAYFEAYLSIDSMDPRAPLSIDGLVFGTETLRIAMEWAGEPEQQEAVLRLLQKDGRLPNVTFRRAFGLPYGIDGISMDMDDYGFACYVEADRLGDIEFAYLPMYEELWRLLIAESHRRAQDGDVAGGSEALVASMRMSRQLCARAYYHEVTTGMELLLASLGQLRAYMWYYRDLLTVDDYMNIAREVDYIDLKRIALPRVSLLIADQLVETVFADDLRPDPDIFASHMIDHETRNRSPLSRFGATVKWRHVSELHATQEETRLMIEHVDGDASLRWRLPLHDSGYSKDWAWNDLDATRFALVKTAFKGLDKVFPLKYDLTLWQHACAAAAGVAAYQKRENEVLVMDQIARYAPQKLAQIYPAYVRSRDLLVDPLDSSGEMLSYAVITNRDIRNVTRIYKVKTLKGEIVLPEGWPLVYSVGFDEDDDLGGRHSISRDEDGDFIMWPPIELMEN